MQKHLIGLRVLEKMEILLINLNIALEYGNLLHIHI